MTEAATNNCSQLLSTALNCSQPLSTASRERTLSSEFIHLTREPMDPKAIDFELNARRSMWLSDLRQDIRVSRKYLTRSLGFTLVTILTIALGVGSATTVFSVMNALLMRELPVTNPEQLHAVQERRENNLTTSNG